VLIMRDDLGDFYSFWNLKRDGGVDYYELCKKLIAREKILHDRVNELEERMAALEQYCCPEE